MKDGFQSKKAQDNAEEKNVQGKDSPAKQDTRTQQLQRLKERSSRPPCGRLHTLRRPLR